MLQTLPLIFKWQARSAKKCLLRFLLSLALVQAGCESPAPKASRNSGVDKDGQTYYSHVFYFPFESVWRAAQLSIKYPIAVNNMDNGMLETEWIKASDGFQSPSEKQGFSAGYRYKLSLNMVKGRVDGRLSVRVTMRKKMERQRDFFSEVETVTSDGLEELTILYRIDREILIDEAIKKAAAKASKF